MTSVVSLYPSKNWLESAGRSIQYSVPEASECARYVAEQLSALLLARLPGDLSSELLSLLPEGVDCSVLHISGDHDPDRSIGFPAFVERTRHLLGLTELLDMPKYAENESVYGSLCEQVTETYLWAVAQDIPVHIKARMTEHLPTDLRCRMNLYSGHSPQDQVA
jgi:hypothetical protein